MRGTHLTEEDRKKRAILDKTRTLILIGIILVVVIAKLLLSESIQDIFTGQPSGADVYSVAKEFVSPTLKDPEANFTNSRYEFSKRDDSVYVIKSFVETSGKNGNNPITKFEIGLKYKGGPKREQSSWSMLYLDEN